MSTYTDGAGPQSRWIAERRSSKPWPPQFGRPSLSTSGETLTIEESMNLEGKNGERRTLTERWARPLPPPESARPA
jgi:hypothetical protein